MTIAYELYPGTLYLNVTNRCSNDCSFCVRQGPRFSLGGYAMRLDTEPDCDQVMDAIAKAARGGLSRFDEIVFCGFGEPTYRLDLISSVGRALREQGVRVRLNTNGQAALINRKDPFPVLRGAVDEISISLNAPDADTYEDLCAPQFGKAAFDAVADFAKKSAALFETTLTVVGGTLDPEDINRCERMAGELGADFRVR